MAKQAMFRRQRRDSFLVAWVRYNRAKQDR
jgi:hypothetical protein